MILPALERIHELPWRLQTAAHHDRLLSNNGQGILQQPRLVFDRRRSGRHVGSGIVYRWESSPDSKMLLLPLRADPERLHWFSI